PWHPTRGAAGDLRIGRQPQHCEDPRSYDSVVVTPVGGPAHRIAMLDQRGQLLRAAVGFAGCSMPSYDPALWALRTWLDSWRGIGHVAAGMHRLSYDLQLTQYDERGWRATFYTAGLEHSPVSAIGTGWETTPWRAVQRAAWDALKRADGIPSR